jgi:hypothetical protein
MQYPVPTNPASLSTFLKQLPLSSDAPTVLAKHAAEIRQLGKRSVANVIEIGRLLTICHGIIGHGDWYGWLDRELGLSPQAALNFMRVFELAQSKSTNFVDLNLPVSALFLLAAPGTPTKIRDEVIARAERGEIIKFAEAKRAIGKRKQSQGKPVTPGDEALSGFTACLCDLQRRIGNHPPSRFVRTAVASDDLNKLSRFLSDLVELREHQRGAQ